ncbi:hypothetical protein, partial [Helicobacter mesocricetorum]|uniref:hypothetical protein n=1 Tax=Helicobacter mesocricetorum TaxID=87012 RepID=UPI00131530D5
MQVTNNISLSTPKITQKFIEEREKNREENKKLMQTLLEERTKLMQAILEVPGGELVAFLLPSEKYPNKFLAEISLENMRYLVNVGRIKNDVIDEHSQKFTNVSEESYQSAKAYIYKQMEDIALAIYEEEGDSGLLGTLMEIGRFRQIIDIAEDIKENKLESSARELAWVLKTEDKEKIAKAQERIEIYLDKMWNANTVGLAITIHFFTLVDSKIPAENFQKIKDSLGIMRNYIENNFIPNEQGI